RPTPCRRDLFLQIASPKPGQNRDYGFVAISECPARPLACNAYGRVGLICRGPVSGFTGRHFEFLDKALCEIGRTAEPDTVGDLRDRGGVASDHIIRLFQPVRPDEPVRGLPGQRAELAM